MSPELHPALVERVLAKLGFAAAPAADFAGLRALYAAWCGRVPFDNVRKLIQVRSGSRAPLPGDQPADFFEAWLAHGTGGTCWAGNGALHALLAALGFRAERGIGTMLVAPNVPPNHGTVIVGFDTARYMVDASMLHGEPLRLEAQPSEVTHPAWGVQCARRDDGRWHIRWRPLYMPSRLECSVYRLDAGGASLAQFQQLHERTRAWSPFNYQLYARINRRRCVLVLADGERVAFDGAGSARRRLSAPERLRVLVEELGMSEEIVQRIPADRRTPPAPASRAARRLAAGAETRL